MLHIFAVLPHGLKEIMANGSGWIMWHLNGRSRKITVRNLEICFPNMPADERTKLARRSLVELNLSILDAGRNWVWQPERLEQQVTRVVGMDDLRAAVANGSGTVVMSPHLGSWEIVNLCLSKEHKVTTLYREPKAAFFGEIIRQKRQRRGANLVQGGAAGCRAMLKALKSGEVVSLLPDQVPPRKLGKFAPFFGEPTLTMTLATNLIHRTGAKALCSYCKRLPNGEFELVFQPVDEAVYDPDPSIALAALNKSIERCIMDCPEQYRWEYKRFKFLPNLQKRDYFDRHGSNSNNLTHRQA